MCTLDFQPLLKNKVCIQRQMLNCQEWVDKSQTGSQLTVITSDLPMSNVLQLSPQPALRLLGSASNLSSLLDAQHTNSPVKLHHRWHSSTPAQTYKQTF